MKRNFVSVVSACYMVVLIVVLRVTVPYYIYDYLSADIISNHHITNVLIPPSLCFFGTGEIPPTKVSRLENRRRRLPGTALGGICR